jgi:transcriptional regulator with XRE-family HTH domain
LYAYKWACQEENVAATEKSVSLKFGIVSALQLLQARLGETQEGMARRVGCTLGAWSKWYRGENTPRGDWMLKILALCPDDETRSAFGAALGADVPAQIVPPKSDVELARYFNDALQGLKILYEAAAAGSPGARESLRHEADRLVERAAQWRDAQNRLGKYKKR